MARQVLPIVGLIVGAYFGNPQLGYAIGTVIGNAVDPLTIQGPKIGDVAAQTSSEGVYQPIYFGTAAGAGNMIAQGPNIIKKVEEQEGKGGPVTVTERLYKTFAIRIGVGWNGPITGVCRIWEDEKLVYDIRPGSTILTESAKFARGFRLYLGTEDQLPDPDLEAIYGIGNTPAYVGRAYIVFPKKDITDRRSISSYRFEVVGNPDGAIVNPGFSETATISGAYETVYTYLKSNGNLAFASAATVSIADGGIFTVGEFNSDLTVLSSTAVTWNSTGSPGDSRLFFRATEQGGKAISADDTYGYCKLLNNGAYVAFYRPSDAIADTWWYNEAGYSPEYGGLIFFDDFHMYLGVRRTGASGNYANRLLKFGLTGPSPVAEVALATGVGTTNNPRFWMHRSRDTNIYVISQDGTFSAYNSSLVLQYTIAFPLSINDLRGFGIDNGRICMVYGAGGGAFTGVVSFYKILDWSLLSSFNHASVYGNVNTKVTFSDDSCYIQCRNFVGRIEVAQIAPAGMDLSDIVSTIHGFVKQDSSKFNVTELEGINVDGLILAGGYSGADAIRTLAGIYFFDSPEYDKKIYHRLRGKPVVNTFVYEDLVDEPEESTREQAIEYPRKLHLDYQNAIIEYAPAKATSARESQDIRVVGEANLQAPVVLDADLAAQKAAILHKISWADADGEVTFTIPDKFLGLVAGDCVGLSLRGTVRRLRIDKQEYNPGTIKLFTRNDRQSAYTSNVTGVPVPIPTPPPPSIVGPSEIEALDIPALLDIHDQSAPVRYIAVGGLTPAWYGASVQESLDAGANFSPLISNFSPGTTMGTLLDDVADASEHYPDTTNVLHVQFDLPVEIDSLTNAQFLSEGGALAVENADGTWELMQYRDADDLGDGEYTFSPLLRGRLNSGTESHLAGRRVVVLAGVQVVSTQSSYIGQSVVHRAISFGESAETASIDTITYEAKSQQEWPVANILLQRVVNTINVTIVPRHRFGTEDNPVQSINWIGYRITATDGANTITLPDHASPTAAIDATGWASPVTVTVAQLNRITGPGPSESESIA